MTRHLLIILLLSSTACAPFWVVSRIEDKVDRLVKNTDRETLNQLFGDQASVINAKMQDLNDGQKEQLQDMMGEFETGSRTLDEVRSSVLGVMGGGERVVSSKRGIWVRSSEGVKKLAIARNTKLRNCKPLTPEELPERISKSKGLSNLSWGSAEYKGEQILFPWELTMSGFTKEIVENTARRTAEEFIKMAGDRAWNRPINIQVITEPQGNGLKISYPGDENEIFVSTDGKKKSKKGVDEKGLEKTEDEKKE